MLRNIFKLSWLFITALFVGAILLLRPYITDDGFPLAVIGRSLSAQFIINLKYASDKKNLRPPNGFKRCGEVVFANGTSRSPAFEQDCDTFVNKLKTYSRHQESQFQARFRSANICRTMSIYDQQPLQTLERRDARNTSQTNGFAECRPPRLMMVSLCVEPDRYPFCNLTFRRMQEYADLHGYTFKSHYGKLFLDKNSYWQKAFWINELLHDPHFVLQHDIIAWLDDDVLIMNNDVRLENYFQLGHPDVQLVMSRDIDVYDPNKFANSAVYLLKVANETALYFSEVIKKYDSNPYWRTNRFHEQSAMILTIYESFHERTLVLPLCFLQCFWNPDIKQWHPSCFSLHVVGTETNQRIQLIQFLANLTRDQANWLLSKYRITDCFNEFPSFYFLPRKTTLRKQSENESLITNEDSFEVEFPDVFLKLFEPAIKSWTEPST